MNEQARQKKIDGERTVHWASCSYRVIKSKWGEFMILCDLNDSCVGLTWKDEVTMNGEEKQFYICGDCTQSGILI